MQDYSFDSVLENALGMTPTQGDKVAHDAVLMIPLANIRANPRQPRKEFDETSLKELAASIKGQGVLQPILVEEIAPGEYSIVAGERRFRASKLAGLDTIPVLVKDFTDLQRLEANGYL